MMMLFENNLFNFTYSYKFKTFMYLFRNYSNRTNTTKPFYYVYLKKTLLIFCFMFPFLFGKKVQLKKEFNLILQGSSSQDIYIDLSKNKIKYKFYISNDIFKNIHEVYQFSSKQQISPTLLEINKNKKELIVEFINGDLLGYDIKKIILINGLFPSLIKLYKQFYLKSINYNKYVKKQLQTINHFLKKHKIPILNQKYNSDIVIPLALTHGDIGLNNILVTNKGLKIIDWEFVRKRSAFYDLIFLQLLLKRNLGNYFFNQLSETYNLFSNEYKIDIKNNFKELLYLTMLERMNLDINSINEFNMDEQIILKRVTEYAKDINRFN